MKKIKTKVVFDNGVLIMLLKEKSGTLYANGVTFNLKAPDIANREHFEELNEVKYGQCNCNFCQVLREGKNPLDGGYE